MGSKHNRKRAKWQDYSGEKAGKAEKSFFEVFVEHFKDTSFQIRSKPKDFNSLYVDVGLSKKELSEIYTPPKKITKHGITPDYAIDNLQTGKTLYVEVKRQDGWVEGKKRQAGRGNAHERSNKFFTPGLLKTLRNKGKVNTEGSLPFWTVFQGDITRDPCRVREITLWYDDYSAHYFFWRDSTNSKTVTLHFDKFLKHLLN